MIYSLTQHKYDNTTLPWSLVSQIQSQFRQSWIHLPTIMTVQKLSPETLFHLDSMFANQ